MRNSVHVDKTILVILDNDMRHQKALIGGCQNKLVGKGELISGGNCLIQKLCTATLSCWFDLERLAVLDIYLTEKFGKTRLVGRFHRET